MLLPQLQLLVMLLPQLQRPGDAAASALVSAPALVLAADTTASNPDPIPAAATAALAPVSCPPCPLHPEIRHILQVVRGMYPVCSMHTAQFWAILTSQGYSLWYISAPLPAPWYSCWQGSCCGQSSCRQQAFKAFGLMGSASSCTLLPLRGHVSVAPPLQVAAATGYYLRATSEVPEENGPDCYS